MFVLLRTFEDFCSLVRFTCFLLEVSFWFAWFNQNDNGVYEIINEKCRGMLSERHWMHRSVYLSAENVSDKYFGQKVVYVLSEQTAETEKIYLIFDVPTYFTRYSFNSFTFSLLSSRCLFIHFVHFISFLSCSHFSLLRIVSCFSFSSSLPSSVLFGCMKSAGRVTNLTFFLFFPRSLRHTSIQIHFQLLWWFRTYRNILQPYPLHSTHTVKFITYIKFCQLSQSYTENTISTMNDSDMKTEKKCSQKGLRWKTQSIKTILREIVQLHHQNGCK